LRRRSQVRCANPNRGELARRFDNMSQGLAGPGAHSKNSTLMSSAEVPRHTKAVQHEHRWAVVRPAHQDVEHQVGCGLDLTHLDHLISAMRTTNEHRAYSARTSMTWPALIHANVQASDARRSSPTACSVKLRGVVSWCCGKRVPLAVLYPWKIMVGVGISPRPSD
jgi:hypothetical protein